MHTRLALLLAGIWTCVAGLGVRAEALKFLVDPTLSEIELSGEVAKVKVSEQAPGSLKTRFGGSIWVEWTPTTIRFPGGSRVDAVTNGVWEPNVGGRSGSAPGDFAGQARQSFFTVKGTFRDIVLDVMASSVPLQNGAFDPGNLQFGFPEGSTSALDYDFILVRNRIPLVGLATNRISNAGTLTTEGAVQKLTLRVDADQKFKALTENDSTIRFLGTIVAYRGREPQIDALRWSDGKWVLVAGGLSATARVERSSDLKTWTPKEAIRGGDSIVTTFTLEPGPAPEYFRVAQ